MKSEHRHELHTNDLGKLTEKATQSVTGFFDTHGNRIMIVVCVVSLALAAIIYYVRRSNYMEANAWRQLAFSRKDTDFAAVSEDFKGTSAAPWAKLQEAEVRLAQGIQFMFTNREAGLLELKKSREALETLVNDRGVRGEVRERALYALARCQESTAHGDTSEAVATYEKLLKEFPNTVYKSFAEKQVAELKTSRAKDFYTWFAKQNPKPPAAKKPADHGTTDTDDLLDTLAPSLSLPKNLETSAPRLELPGATDEKAAPPAEKKESEKKEE